MSVNGCRAGVQCMVCVGLSGMAGGQPAEQAAPDCVDAHRVADASTIRRWAWRRIRSLPFWLAARQFFRAPTIFAWYFQAAAGMLTVDPSPP